MHVVNLDYIVHTPARAKLFTGWLELSYCFIQWKVLCTL